MKRDVWVVKLHNQTQRRPILPRETLRIYFHNRAQAGKDVTDPVPVPVFLGEIPNHNIAKPLRYPNKAVISVLNPLKLVLRRGH